MLRFARPSYLLRAVTSAKVTNDGWRKWVAPRPPRADNDGSRSFGGKQERPLGGRTFIHQPLRENAVGYFFDPRQNTVGYFFRPRKNAAGSLFTHTKKLWVIYVPISKRCGLSTYPRQNTAGYLFTRIKKPVEIFFYPYQKTCGNI